jgi:hypothetical protein
LFVVVDGLSGVLIYHTEGTVIQTVYKPSRYTSGVGTAIGADGKVGVVNVSSYESEEWKVICTANGQTFSASCTSDQWGRLREGRSVLVQQKRGLFTDWAYGWRVAY